MLRLRLIDHAGDSVVLSFTEADGSWWVPRTSNPACGATSVAGGFDSHALPPYLPEKSITYPRFIPKYHDKNKKGRVLLGLVKRVYSESKETKMKISI